VELIGSGWGLPLQTPPRANHTFLEALMGGQERLDEVVVSSAFTLEEAISSLRFYWGLARHKGEPITVEVWAKAGAVVPQKEVANAAQTS
jgi:hypothetical protein